MAANTKDTKGNLSSRLLILIFVLLAAGIVVAGYLFYSNYEKNYRAQVENQLSAIADLKVGELVQWRKERLADANLLYRNPAFSSLVQRYFEDPDDVVAQEQLRSWLAHFQAYDQYARIFLLDTRGAARISVPDTAEPIPRHIPQDAQQALQSGKVTVLDLDRDEDTQQPHMVILTPIFRENNTSVPLGVVAMRIDPYQYLYPLIQKWPAPSTTAETLIVRRDGNDALFLNDLRFKKDSALNLRYSLDNITMPAVQAALGHEGIMEGIDYRGVPVIADVRAVPDSPWFMVARVDISEVYSPLSQLLWVIIALVGALLIGAGAGVGLVQRQRNVRVYKEKAEIADVLRESEERYRDLVNFSKNGVAVYQAAADGEDFIFKDFNRAAESIDNVKKEDIIGKSVLQAFPGVREFGLFEVFQRVWRTGEPERHPITRYHDDRIGGWRDNYVYRLPSGEIVAVYEDVTQRIQAEEELKNSNDQIKNLAARLQMSREDERKTIAVEIHDDLGQSITALQIDLSWLIKRIPRDQKELLEKAESMLRLVKVTDEKVRQISTELRPPLLDDLGFVSAAQSYLSEFEENTGVKCDFFSEPGEIILDANVSIALYRVLQGALSNIAKHAKATRVKISLVEQTDGLYMEISDNGRGITQKEIASIKSIGIIGMRERIAFFGGSVQIEGSPGNGTAVKVKIPVQGDMFE